MWGEVGRSTSISRTNGDYPHQCGEKNFLLPSVSPPLGLPPPVWGEAYLLPAASIAVIGLPPPVWGEDVGSWGYLISLRITPTSVGRSDRPFLKRPMWEDYPHQCGEKDCVNPKFLIDKGLPPPVWGEVGRSTSISRTNGDYPHQCGEKTKKTLLNQYF